MQVCTSLQTENHANTPVLSFLQAGCPSCHPTNSIKALKEMPFSSVQTKPSSLRTNCSRLMLDCKWFGSLFQTVTAIQNSSSVELSSRDVNDASHDVTATISKAADEAGMRRVR